MDMAPHIIPEPLPQTTTTSPSPSQHNLFNPLPLSASQEAQVRDIYHKRVRAKCAQEIKDFAACAAGRTFTVTWTCRAQHFAMNSCMIAHATKAEADAAREEWFAGVLERRKQKEAELAAVEKRRVEVIAMMRKQEEKERIELEQKKAQDAAKLKTSDVVTVPAVAPVAAGGPGHEEKKGGWFWGK